MNKFLLVEDDPLVAEPLLIILEDLGYEPVNASSLDEAVAEATRGGFAAALIDVSMPMGDTREVARRLASNGVPFAVCSGLFPSNYQELYGAAPRLLKPFTASALERTLKDLVANA